MRRYHSSHLENAMASYLCPLSGTLLIVALASMVCTQSLAQAVGARGLGVDRQLLQGKHEVVL
jgi:hypothetical protein